MKHWRNVAASNCICRQGGFYHEFMAPFPQFVTPRLACGRVARIAVGIGAGGRQLEHGWFVRRPRAAGFATTGAEFDRCRFAYYFHAPRVTRLSFRRTSTWLENCVEHDISEHGAAP